MLVIRFSEDVKQFDHNHSLSVPRSMCTEGETSFKPVKVFFRVLRAFVYNADPFLTKQFSEKNLVLEYNAQEKPGKSADGC